MRLLSVTASPALSGFAVMSKYFFTAGLCMLIVMTLAYLWYTVGSARLAKQLAVERARSQRRSKASESKAVAAAGGGVTMLESSEVVLHEQPDGEKPIALNSSLAPVGGIDATFRGVTVLTV